MDLKEEYRFIRTGGGAVAVDWSDPCSEEYYGAPTEGIKFITGSEWRVCRIREVVSMILFCTVLLAVSGCLILKYLLIRPHST